MGDSRLDVLRYAATEFVSGKAVDVSENWDAVSFRIGERAIAVSLGPDGDSFTVLVDTEYEGTLRLKTSLVHETVDEIEHKFLHLHEPEYKMNDDKRHPMPPGPAYSLLALGVVVASIFGYYLYGVLLNLKDCMRIAYALLNQINDSAEVPKAHNWGDDPKFLDVMVEAYVYLIV